MNLCFLCSNKVNPMQRIPLCNSCIGMMEQKLEEKKKIDIVNSLNNLYYNKKESK